MWQYTRELLALLFVAFLGYGLVATMLRGSIHLLSRVELASYSFAVGLGTLTASMLLLSLFEVPFSLHAILLFGVIPAALLLAGRKIRVAEISCARTVLAKHIFVSSAILPQGVSILVLIATLFFVLVGCLNEPIYEFDPIAAWALHAKVFYCDHTAFPLLLIVGYLAFTLAFMAASAYSVSHHANLDMRRVLIRVAPVAAMVIGLLSAVQDPQAEAH